MDAAMNPGGPPTTGSNEFCNWNPVVGKNW